VPTPGRDGTKLARRPTEASLFEAILGRIGFLGLPKAGNTDPTYDKQPLKRHNDHEQSNLFDGFHGSALEKSHLTS
jgi:hypothetical protein